MNLWKYPFFEIKESDTTAFTHGTNAFVLMYMCKRFARSAFENFCIRSSSGMKAMQDRTFCLLWTNTEHTFLVYYQLFGNITICSSMGVCYYGCQVATLYFSLSWEWVHTDSESKIALLHLVLSLLLPRRSQASIYCKGNVSIRRWFSFSQNGGGGWRTEIWN